jgi:hypothetical protein
VWLGVTTLGNIMKKMNQNLSEIFDVQPIMEESNTEIIEVVSQPSDNEIDDDFNLARNNLKQLLNKSDTAIDNLLKVAEESEHPRAYEVAATLIKTMADLNKDLLDIRKKKNDLLGRKEIDIEKPFIDKAVFVGSTTDLIKMIKNKNSDDRN